MEFIELEPLAAPRLRQRFEGHVEADFVRTSSTRSRARAQSGEQLDRSLRAQGPRASERPHD
jgi:hypothetical protein